MGVSEISWGWVKKITLHWLGATGAKLVWFGDPLPMAPSLPKCIYYCIKIVDSDAFQHYFFQSIVLC